MARRVPGCSAALVALIAGLGPALGGSASHTCAPGACLSTGHAALDAALDDAAGGSLMLRASMLDALARSPKCFPSDLTKEEWAAILVNHAELLPPTQAFAFDPFSRYWTDSPVWRGASLQGASGAALATSLTYSFPDDNVTWGLSAISATGANTLNARLTTLFGAANLDLGREYMRMGFAAWRTWTGLRYTEVADNNTAMAEDITPNAARGDLRVGGRNFGTSTFLAYNAFPSAAGMAGVGGGDMCFNTSFFLANNFNNPQLSYRYLRNTAAHEHGHGLGNIHSVPCNSSKLMEPSIHLGTNTLGIDDIRGGQRNYGDRHAGNHSSGTAKDFGDLASPSVRSVVERRLSTNGASGPGGTNADWFKFTLDSPQSLSISVAPQVSAYTAGQQSFSCSGSTASINAAAAGNLNIELYDGTVTQIASATSAAAGATETIAAAVRPAGTYYVRVVDVGPNPSAAQTVQLYDLTIRLGSSKSAPLAIAGINKRVPANTNCFFLGDIYTISNETGALIEAASAYEWDLDGDGTFEIAGNARPQLQYVSNGVYPVSMRVTEPSGPSAVDTINVTVFGATTSVTDVSPMSGDQGAIVPVTITGTNLRNLTDASHVTVSGTGVTVTGSPAPNGFGTLVSGLSFVVDPGAAPGPRNVSITNADGSGVGNGLFVVNKSVIKTPCPADLDGDGAVGPSDLASLLGAWGAKGPADFDGGGVGPSDLATLLGTWGPCP